MSWLTPQQDWRQLFIAGGLLTLALAPAPLSAGGVVAAMAPPVILAGMAAFGSRSARRPQRTEGGRSLLVSPWPPVLAIDM